MKFQRTRNPDNGNDHPAPEEEKRGPGETSHGAFSALRLYKTRDLDLRRSDHRAIHEWRESIISDLGGLPSCDTFQLSLIDRCVELMIVTSTMALYAEEKGIMDKSGELAPCLRVSYLQYVNSFRHCLIAIYEHGQKKPKKLPGLEDYLSKYNEKEESENEGHRSQAKKEAGFDCPTTRFEAENQNGSG